VPAALRNTMATVAAEQHERVWNAARIESHGVGER
jgi:hypothetical protein